MNKKILIFGLFFVSIITINNVSPGLFSRASYSYESKLYDFVTVKDPNNISAVKLDGLKKKCKVIVTMVDEMGNRTKRTGVVTAVRNMSKKKTKSIPLNEKKISLSAATEFIRHSVQGLTLK